jgi:UDPglucose 6-dehydrogenase
MVREFRSSDFEFIRRTLRPPLIFDGRNMFEPAVMQAMGIEYRAIGRDRSIHGVALSDDLKT